MRTAIMAALLLSFPMALGFNCNALSQQDRAICDEIYHSTVEDSLKESLIASVAYQDHNYPNHTYVYDWNKRIIFDKAPESVITQSSGNIQDAWLRIIGIMPSVILDKRLLSPGNGKIMSAYNYRVEMPSGTNGGDCRTEYRQRTNNPNLKIFLNGQQIGTSILTDFQGSEQLNFKATLDITYAIDAKHYHTYKRCCLKDKYRRCIKYCEECRYDSTETIADHLRLEDSKRAYQDLVVISPDIKAVDSYHGTTVGILNVSNFASFRLMLDNSSLAQYNFYYDLNISFPPYDVFTLKANNFTAMQSKNLHLEPVNKSYKFYVPNPKSCKIRLFDHFHSSEQECSLEYNETKIDFKTDKLIYDEGETIISSLEPKNALMKVKYGAYETNAKGTFQLAAKENLDRISISFGEREINKIIHVRKKSAWDFALNFGIFSGIIYSFYLALNKSWGGLF